MANLTTAQQRERTARLLVAPPEEVARELDRYGDLLRREENRGDESLERALLERDEPLIALALARNAQTEDVVQRLYRSGKQPPTNPQDAAYKSGLRCACLANSSACFRLFLARPPFSLMSDAELAELARQGDIDECHALLSNAALRDSCLIALYERNGSFSAIDDDRWQQLVVATATNPRLVTEIDYPDAPDLEFMDVHRALFGALGRYQISWNSSWGLYELLVNLNPFLLPPPNSAKEVRTLLGSWQGIAVTGYRGREREGEYTQLSWVDELRCLTASYYGEALEYGADGKLVRVSVGDRNAPDVALRCAAYGHGKLTPDQMKSDFERDGLAFTLAALSNIGAFNDQNRKIIEEQFLQGKGLIRLYDQRCKQFSKQFPRFVVRPLSETGVALTDGIVPPEATSLTEVRAEVSEVQKSLTTLSGTLGRLQAVVLWGLLVLALLVLWRR